MGQKNIIDIQTESKFIESVNVLYKRMQESEKKRYIPLKTLKSCMLFYCRIVSNDSPEMKHRKEALKVIFYSTIDKLELTN